MRAVELLREEALKTALLRNMLMGLKDGSIPPMEQKNVVSMAITELTIRRKNLEVIADILQKHLMPESEIQVVVGHA